MTERNASRAQEYDWIMNRSGLPWLRLDVEVPAAEIFQELQGYLQRTKSQQPGKHIKGWRGLTLHGLGSDKPRPHTEYGYGSEDDAPYAWTDVGQACHVTREFVLKRFPCKRLYRVKVNHMEPGGSIPPHRDAKRPGLGLTIPSDEKVRYLTVAIRWPQEVIYNVGRHRLPISDGDAYLIDFSNHHAVYNRSNEHRLSLIVSADFSDSQAWQSLVLRSHKKFGNEHLKKIPLPEYVGTRVAGVASRVYHGLRR